MQNRGSSVISSVMVELVSTLSKFTDSIWGYYLPVPEEVASQFVQGNFRRVVCTLNNQHTLHAAILPNKGRWYILVSQPILKKLKLKEGDKVRVILEQETSTYGMPMPEELEICLWQEDEAMSIFEGLTPGKQRSLIYIVSKIKSPDIRINKSLVIARHLSESKGKLDYKRLNEMFKDFNSGLRMN